MEIASQGKYPVAWTPNLNKEQLLSYKFCFTN